MAATLATTLGLMLAAANPALSQSGESNEFVFKGYRTAPDIPTNLNGTFVKPNQVAVTNLSTFAVTALTFPGVLTTLMSQAITFRRRERFSF